MIREHRLSDAIHFDSPNCSKRPADTEIALLVIHNISLPPRIYGGSHIDDFFCNRLDIAKHAFFTEIADMHVSAHLLIRRDGTVHQYVPFDRKAWHAGQSSFQGRENCNEFSIGIELEGCDEDIFTVPQYEQLAKVTVILQAAYPGITPDRIVGHSDIAPGRKTDPGPCFDWAHYRQLSLLAAQGFSINKAG